MLWSSLMTDGAGGRPEPPFLDFSRAGFMQRLYRFCIHLGHYSELFLCCLANVTCFCSASGHESAAVSVPCCIVFDSNDDAISYQRFVDVDEDKSLIRRPIVESV